MKKPASYLYHQRTVQTSHQQDRYKKLEQQQRIDRLKDYQINNNTNINNQHYRKHNSPDAQKLRSYQQLQSQGQGMFNANVQNQGQNQVQGKNTGQNYGQTNGQPSRQYNGKSNGQSNGHTHLQTQKSKALQQHQNLQQKQENNKRQRTLGLQQNSNNYQNNTSNKLYTQQLQQNNPNTQKNQKLTLPKTASSPKLLESNNHLNDIPQSTRQHGGLRQKLYTQTDEYQKLHQKLNSIQDKIMNMKKNIQRKREQKQKLIQKQKKQQQQKQKQRAKSSQNKKSSNPLKGLVTQVPEHKQLHTFERNPYSPRHNIYYVSQIVRAYLDDKSLAREHLLTSLHILRILQRSQLPSQDQMRRRRVDLPLKKGKQGKKCVVFDLDQTLIHCNDSLTPPHDVKLPIKFPTGEVIQAGINIRPYAREILKNLSLNFQVIVFTASHSCYANVVLDYLDPTDQYIDHRLFREHCYQTAEGMYVKDLRVMNRDLKDVILVDNAAYSYAFQLDNGIPILPYYHGTQDYQLNVLEKYLEGMVGISDVRQLNRQTFGLYKYRQYYTEPQRLVEQLYISEQVENNKKN